MVSKPRSGSVSVGLSRGCSPGFGLFPGTLESGLAAGLSGASSPGKRREPEASERVGFPEPSAEEGRGLVWGRRDFL